jgi:hypothetical protein
MVTVMDDPTVAQLRREFPGWHVWKGIAGLWYARRLDTSPPIVVHDENTTELRAQIRAREGELNRR